LLRQLLWAAGLSVSLAALPLSARAQDAGSPPAPAETVVAPTPPSAASADEFAPQSSFTDETPFFAANNTPFASGSEGGL
jgi:hypothetical protein